MSRSHPRFKLLPLALATILLMGLGPRSIAQDTTTPISAHRSVSLNGAWKLTYGPLKNVERLKEDPTQAPANFATVPATVPGSVELDLIAAGRLSDPMIGSQVYEVLKLESYQWWYSRKFGSPQLSPGEKAVLVFDGLDCMGTVWLNGTLVGRPANMLIPHRFDVTSQLRKTGDNEVLVRIDPAVVIGNQATHYPGEFNYPGLWEQMVVRKPNHMYGWDIMPRIVSAGLWRDVRLEVIPPTHLNGIYWATRSLDLGKHSAELMLDWDFSTDRLELSSRPLKVRVTLSRNGKAVYRDEIAAVSTHGQESLHVKDVDFWWPRGAGEPALYDAAIALLDEQGDVLDENKTRVGIRTVKLHHVDRFEPSEAGDMSFIVNGRKLFIKGVNWGVLDAFHSRDSQRLDAVFSLLVGANCNMIRRYGICVYGPDRLFDLCDENGVLILQEFAMGNQRCPQTESFRMAMEAESASVITQYRNHPSLTIWCGGNEFDGDYMIRDGLDPNSDIISRSVFPKAITLLDPHRDYMPCCWYLDPIAVARGVPVNKWVPDDHLYLWSAPYYFKSPFYTSLPTAHFISEIGWKGCPSRASLEQMFTPGALNPWVGGNQSQWNDEWKTKATQPWPSRPEGNERMNLLNNQLKTVFTEIPKDLDDYIVASQAAQAEATKFFIESSRIRKGDASGPAKDKDRWGVLLFQFMDGWPLVSFGVVDYYNRPKLAYDAMCESMRDVQAICGEAEGGRHPVVIVNDTLNPVKGHVAVRKVGDSSLLLDKDFNISANGKDTVDWIPQPKSTEMWQIEWMTQDGRRFKSHYLSTNSTVLLKDYIGWMKQLAMRLP